MLVPRRENHNTTVKQTSAHSVFLTGRCIVDEQHSKIFISTMLKGHLAETMFFRCLYTIINKQCFPDEALLI